MSQLLLGCFWFPKWAPSYCEPPYLLSELFSQFKNKTVQMSKKPCWLERPDCSEMANTQLLQNLLVVTVLKPSLMVFLDGVEMVSKYLYPISVETKVCAV